MDCVSCFDDRHDLLREVKTVLILVKLIVINGQNPWSIYKRCNFIRIIIILISWMKRYCHLPYRPAVKYTTILSLITRIGVSRITPRNINPVLYISDAE